MGLYVLLSNSQEGPGRNFSQPRTNHFFLSVLRFLLPLALDIQDAVITSGLCRATQLRVN